MQEYVGVVDRRCHTCHSEKGSERSIMYTLGEGEWPCDDAFHLNAVVASDHYASTVVRLCCKKLRRARGMCVCSDYYTCPEHGEQHNGTHD